MPRCAVSYRQLSPAHRDEIDLLVKYMRAQGLTRKLEILYGLVADIKDARASKRESTPRVHATAAHGDPDALELVAGHRDVS